MKTKIINEVCSAVFMASMFTALLLHGCGLNTAAAVDLAIGCIAIITPVKKRAPGAHEKAGPTHLQGVIRQYHDGDKNASKGEKK